MSANKKASTRLHPDQGPTSQKPASTNQENLHNESNKYQDG